MNVKVVTFFTAKKCHDVKNGLYAGTIHHRVVQSDNGLVFRRVRLEHETRAKYETCSCSNTDACMYEALGGSLKYLRTPLI